MQGVYCCKKTTKKERIHEKTTNFRETAKKWQINLGIRQMSITSSKP